MKAKKILFIYLLTLGSIYCSFSQNLMDILEKEQQDTLGFIPATFKMTRVAFGHSTEVRSKGVLEIFVANRFWNLPTDRSQSFAADRMSSRFALEYGLSDRLSFGVGATTFDGLFDGYLKYKLLTQKKGSNPSPFNITIFQGSSYNSSAMSL